MPNTTNFPIFNQAALNTAGANTESLRPQGTVLNPGQGGNMQVPTIPYGFETPGNAGDIGQIRATGQSVLANNYFQTPGYQLLFGSGVKQMDPSLSPVERFQADPAYQWQQDEAMRQIQRGAASQGLLGSGGTQRALLEASQGIANQGYQNFWNQLNANYGNYQNALAQLAGSGMANTGAQGAAALGQGNAALTAGLGENGASLLSNQGMAGLGAYMNTGAGLSGNVMQGLSIQAQIDAANAAAKNQSQSSAMQGIGSVVGMLGGMF